MGAVSAFGMSGTNAHMVVQSYTGGEEAIQQSYPCYLLALSAKTPESLQEKAKDLIEVLQNKTISEYDLTNLSYTLLEGRQHFDYRCVIVAQDRENAVYLLKQVGSKERVPNVFQGKVPRDFTSQKAFEQYGSDLLRQSQTLTEDKIKYREILFALAELYCQGYQLDWNLLFGNRKLPRIHLPTYPFVKEEYWVDESKSSLETESLTIATINQSRAALYEQLIDEVTNGKMGTEVAVQKTLKLIGISK